MRVAIIVPVYNTAPYLRECLDSIAGQQYDDLQVVVIDDGSTDGSAGICDEYASHAGWTVIHTPNQGVSAARNLGVERADAPYIAFVDSDDVVHPAYVDVLVGAMRSCRAAAAMCRFTDCDLSDMTVLGSTGVLTTRRAIERTLYQRGCDSSLCCKLLPRPALLQAQQRTDRRYEDLDSIYRVYEAIDGDIATTTAAPYYYRRNPGSFINNFTPERLDVLDVTADIEKHYADDPQLLRAARSRRFAANYNMLRLCTRAGDTAAADSCWLLIRNYRMAELCNPRTRLKNRLGALLAVFGRKAATL